MIDDLRAQMLLASIELEILLTKMKVAKEYCPKWASIANGLNGYQTERDVFAALSTINQTLRLLQERLPDEAS